MHTRSTAAALILLPLVLTAQGSLRFFGNGSGAPDLDRVKIPVDDPATNLPGPAADIGAADLTIECWVRGDLTSNAAGPITCGNNVDWINGNILIDRDRFNQDRKFGLSFGAGSPVFGVSGQGTGDRTICGSTLVLDGQWHHLAVARRRSDGFLWLWVDGILEASVDGPDGDISYPDNGIPGPYCGGPCTNSDPYLVLGAEKHDAGPAYPSFTGWMDELRLSAVLRYPNGDFVPPSAPFTPDAATAALYHFDEGTGTTAFDAASAPGGPGHGILRVGGSPVGPAWSIETPFPGMLDVRAWLAGPFDALAGRMRDDLRAQALVPTAETCTASGFAPVGHPGGEMCAPPVLSVTGEHAVVDWVHVALIDPITTATVATRNGLLLRSGRLVAPDGTGALHFGVSGSFRVRIRHRNHLDVTTAGAVPLGAVPVLVDLRDPSTAVTGAAARQVIGGQALLWPGDASGDRSLRYTGPSNDRDLMLLRVGGAIPTATASGYWPEDVNMDGVVKYTGSGNDRDALLQAIGGAVPTSTRSAQGP